MPNDTQGTISLELVDNSAAGFVGFAIGMVNIHDWIV